MTAPAPGAQRASLRPRSRRRLASPWFAAWQALSFCAVMAVASAPWWPVYASADFVTVLVVGVIAGSFIAVAGTFLRSSSFGILVATVVAFLVLGVAVAVPGQALYGIVPSVAGLRELIGGVALSWKQLLTITLPVGGYQALLVPYFVLVLPGTVIGLSTALRSKRAELALVPPVLVYLTGIVFGATEPVLPVVSGIALLSASVFWLVWWRLRRRRLALEAAASEASPRRKTASDVHRSGNRAVARRALGGVVVTLLVAAGASAIATSAFAPHAGRWVARTAVEKPFDPRTFDSPLNGFRAYEQSPADETTQLEVSGLAKGQFVRVATLDTYNGVDYSVGSNSVPARSGTFTRVPTSFDQSRVHGASNDVTVRLGAYSGVWLPTVGKLETVDFSGPRAATLRENFFYNDTTGTAAVLGGVGEGVSYRLSSVSPRQPSSADLASLTPGTAEVPTPSGVPVALKAALGTYVDGVSNRGGRLRAALEGLKENGYVSHGTTAGEPVSPSGHGSDRLTKLFTDPVMIGDAEQYAAAAALMADELGFPARVVMGFSATDATKVSQGAIDFRGSDITARIEVDTAQDGWVLLDPNPTPRKIPEKQEQDPNQISRPQSVVQPPPQEADPPNDQTQPQSKQDTPADQPAWLAIALAVGRVVGWVALVAGLVMAPFIAVFAVKARRRRRRRRLRDPDRRMTAGWQEFHDSVVDHGIPTPTLATRSEVATAVGGVRPAVLARVVDRAVFAPESTDPAEAERVWRVVGEMRSELDRGLTRWQRFKAAVSHRSLRR